MWFRLWMGEKKKSWFVFHPESCSSTGYYTIQTERAWLGQGRNSPHVNGSGLGLSAQQQLWCSIPTGRMDIGVKQEGRKEEECEDELKQSSPQGHYPRGHGFQGDAVQPGQAKVRWTETGEAHLQPACHLTRHLYSFSGCRMRIAILNSDPIT